MWWALTKGFDPAVSSPATDLWAGLGVRGGRVHADHGPARPDGHHPVTITPSGKKGSVVRGTLYVDQLVVGSTNVVKRHQLRRPAPTEPNANELVGIPTSTRSAELLSVGPPGTPGGRPAAAADSRRHIPARPPRSAEASPTRNKSA